MKCIFKYEYVSCVCFFVLFDINNLCFNRGIISSIIFRFKSFSGWESVFIFCFELLVVYLLNLDFG